MKALVAWTLALSAMTAVAAAEPDLTKTPLDATAASVLPKVQNANGIDYMNGGSGTEGVDYMKARGNEFPLQITFSGPGGQYGVAEKLSVLRGGRELISVADAGPLMMFKLPPGTYTMEATFKGVVEKRNVSVGSGISKVSWNTMRAD
ncbi:MAG: hypothetical protein Q8R33_13650 [Burkholderiales bacterium]|nr:hypothetical protein [Burkholderiales bacterium]